MPGGGRGRAASGVAGNYLSSTSRRSPRAKSPGARDGTEGGGPCLSFVARGLWIDEDKDTG